MSAIITKYSPNQEVYVIIDYRPLKVVIGSISIIVLPPPTEPLISYTVGHPVQYMGTFKESDNPFFETLEQAHQESIKQINQIEQTVYAEISKQVSALANNGIMPSHLLISKREWEMLRFTDKIEIKNYSKNILECHKFFLTALPINMDNSKILVSGHQKLF